MPTFPVPPPCQPEACVIQTCLAKSGFQESACQDDIRKLFECCRRMYEEGGTSTACSKRTVVESRLAEFERR